MKTEKLKLLIDYLLLFPVLNSNNKMQQIGFDLSQLKTFNISESYVRFTPIDSRPNFPKNNRLSKPNVEFKLLALKAIESSKMIPVKPSKQNANEYIY